jgi:hypothetical protein
MLPCAVAIPSMTSTLFTGVIDRAPSSTPTCVCQLSSPHHRTPILTHGFFPLYIFGLADKESYIHSQNWKYFWHGGLERGPLTMAHTQACHSSPLTSFFWDTHLSRVWWHHTQNRNVEAAHIEIEPRLIFLELSIFFLLKEVWSSPLWFVPLETLPMQLLPRLCLPSQLLQLQLQFVFQFPAMQASQWEIIYPYPKGHFVKGHFRRWGYSIKILHREKNTSLENPWSALQHSNPITFIFKLQEKQIFFKDLKRQIPLRSPTSDQLCPDCLLAN